MRSFRPWISAWGAREANASVVSRAALGGQRVAGAGVLLLLNEQLLAGGLPLLGRDDRRHVHRGLSSFR
jgi:hypothetical protein